MHDARLDAAVETLRQYYTTVRKATTCALGTCLRVEVDGYNVPLARAVAKLKTPESVAAAFKRQFTIKQPPPSMVHQRDAVQRFSGRDWHRAPRRVVHLVWSMGAGKTLAAVRCLHPDAATPPPRDVAVLCSNTLIEQWAEVIEKDFQGSGVTEFTVLGYTEFHRRGLEDERFLRRHVVIFDEAHYLRNLTQPMRHDLQVLDHCRTVLALTGTPMVNDAADVVPLLWLSGDRSVPLGTVPTRKQLERVFGGGNASVYDPARDGDERMRARFPEVVRHVHRTPMGWTQALEYVMHARASIRFGPLTLQSSVRNSYNVCTRTASNAPAKGPVWGDGSKLAHMAERVLTLARESLQTADPGRDAAPTRPCQQVVYDEFLERGIAPVYAMVRDHAVAVAGAPLDLAVLTGATPEAERAAAIAAFNAGHVDVLFISRAGNTGVNLTGARRPRGPEQRTAVHFHRGPGPNRQTENQTENRVVRCDGSFDRVHIHVYLAEFPRGRPSDRDAATLRALFWSTYVPPSAASAYRDEIDPAEELPHMLAREDGGRGRAIDVRMDDHNREKDVAIRKLMGILRDLGPLPLVAEERRGAAERVLRKEKRQRARTEQTTTHKRARSSTDVETPPYANKAPSAASKG